MNLLSLAFCLMAAAGGSAAVPASKHAFPGLTIGGPTGMILVPTGQVVQAGWYAVGLHRGSGAASIGLLGISELGFVLPDIYDNPNRQAWLNNTHGFLKLGGEFLPGRAWAPGIAVGIENSLARLSKWAGVQGDDILTARPEQSMYLVGTWWYHVLSWPVDVTAGLGNGRFQRQLFWGGSLIPVTFFGNTLKFTGEFLGRQGAVGARFALSRTLRLDFAMLLNATHTADPRSGWIITIDRGTMGASQTGPIRLDFLKRKPKQPPKPA